MGQSNAKRIQVDLRQTITSLVNDDRLPVASTDFVKVGDVVDVIEEDANGNIVQTIADNLTVLAFDPDAHVVVSAAVDLTGVTGTPRLRNQTLDDMQTAIERALAHEDDAANSDFKIKEPILAQFLNTPSAGKTTYEVANGRFVRAGDTFDVLGDGGLIQAGVVIESVDPKADASANRTEIVITSLVDTSAMTNPFLLSTSVTVQSAIERAQEDIDAIDRPVENEDLDAGNGADAAFEVDFLFRQGTTKVFMDGMRKRLGTAGTRAALTQGAGNAQLIYTSMLLGLLGNEIRVRVVAGAGFTITVAKTFASSALGINTALTSYDITINDNGGTATAAQLAAQLNAHAEVKRIVQVRYGGTGADVVTPFAFTALTGGLNDGAGDYAELEQVFENVIANTGFKWISFHVRPAEPNRLDTPPADTEDLGVDYRRILVNA